MAQQLKVITLVGTRPEIIRLSSLISKLDKLVDHVLVHTGQNKDYKLSEVFFEDLGLRSPDYFLGIDSSSPGAAMADVLAKFEKVLLRESPHALMILGDTNSAIAAVIAERRGVPVYHMEAGNRSFDPNVPEELNRRLVDHVSTFNLPYNSHSYSNLINEGINPRFILETGSPIPEVWERLKPKVMSSDVLKRLQLEPGKFFLASLHRQENVDDPARLRLAMDSLSSVARSWELPIILSTHPRTRSRLEKLGIRDQLIQLHEPFGYLDFNKLQISSKCVISDSGTISEESAIMGFKAVTLRDSMERPEALAAASLTLSGLDPSNLVRCVGWALENDESERPEGYSSLNFSSRVVGFLFSTVFQQFNWTGRRAIG